MSLGLPDRNRYGGLQGRVLYQSYRGRMRPAAHYLAGPAAALGGPGLPVAAGGQRRHGSAGRACGRNVDGRRDPRRSIPPFARRTFRSWFPRSSGGPGDPVLLFVDTFTNYFTPDVGVATVRVLGCRLFTPADRPPAVLRADLDIDQTTGLRPADPGAAP